MKVKKVVIQLSPEEVIRFIRILTDEDRDEALTFRVRPKCSTGVLRILQGQRDRERRNLRSFEGFGTNLKS